MLKCKQPHGHFSQDPFLSQAFSYILAQDPLCLMNSYFELLCGPNNYCHLEQEKNCPIKLGIHFSNVLSILDEKDLIFYYYNLEGRGGSWSLIQCDFSFSTNVDLISSPTSCRKQDRGRQHLVGRMAHPSSLHPFWKSWASGPATAGLGQIKD